MNEIYYEVMRDYVTSIHYAVGKNDSILHFHHQFEMLYIIEGEVQVTINNEKRILSEGQLAVVDCFDNHEFKHIGNAQSACLLIPVQYLKKYSAIMNNRSIKERFITEPERVEAIYQCMNNVVKSLHTNDLIVEGYVSILLGTILQGNVAVDTNKTNYDLVKKILLYIEDNYKSQISLDVISQNFAYSKYYFSHLFNKCFHCNLNDYLNLVRCRHAISFVLEDHMSVSDAAFASGFVSMRTFYRTFKKYFKVTPKEYFRKNHSKNPEIDENELAKQFKA